MLVHLLCPGPSLARYRQPAPRPLTIGVNRAPLGFECDWWCVMDYFIVRDNRRHVLGAPALCSRREQMRHFPDMHGCSVQDDLWPRWKLPANGDETDPGRYCEYSFATGMILALHLGATRLEVYGADWRGVEDFDGPIQAPGLNRSPQRWENEARFFAEVSRFLNSNGCEAIRHELGRND